MDERIWILGGTVAEARDYMRRLRLRPRDCRIIGSAEGIRGNSVNPYQVMRVGRWASRRDLDDIEYALTIAGLGYYPATEEGR